MSGLKNVTSMSRDAGLEQGSVEAGPGDGEPEPE